MKHNKVGSVMTSDVVRAEYGTPFKEIARLLADHRISGLPVVDEDDKVIGVISETDLMARQATTPDPYEPKRRFRLAGLTRSARRQAAKARARTAGQLMTEPPVPVHADHTIIEAARTMAQRRGSAAGSRRGGAAGRHRHPARPAPGLPAARRGDPRRDRPGGADTRPVAATPSVDVSVTEGVVTLTGQTERKSETAIAVSMTRQIDGVVAVVDQLTWSLDDTRLRPDEPALQGVADDWLRRL